MPDNPLRETLERYATATDGPTPDRPEVPYAIFVTPRSGSTWLAELMRDHGLGFPDEWLNFARQEANIRKHGRRDLAGYLLSTLSEHEGPSGASGVELPLLQLMYAFNLDYIFNILGLNTRFVYLRRSNIVRQSISMHVAKQTGVYHVSDADSRWAVSGDQLVYSPAGIKEQIQGILHDEIWFERMFDRQAMQPLRLTYENLKEAPGETIASIASFLGVKAHTPEQRTTRASPVTHDDAAQ